MPDQDVDYAKIAAADAPSRRFPQGARFRNSEIGKNLFQPKSQFENFMATRDRAQTVEFFRQQRIAEQAEFMRQIARTRAEYLRAFRLILFGIAGLAAVVITTAALIAF